MCVADTVLTIARMKERKEKSVYVEFSIEAK